LVPSCLKNYQKQGEIMPPSDYRAIFEMPPSDYGAASVVGMILFRDRLKRLLTTRNSDDAAKVIREARSVEGHRILDK
jgi:hypothetical protein